MLFITKYIHYKFYARTLIKASYDFETIHVTENKKGCGERVIR